MQVDLALTPTGHLAVIWPAGEADDLAPDAGRDPALDRLVKAFASQSAEGLFCLATGSWISGLPPSLAYWREFASRYLTGLCLTPETADSKFDPIPAPPSTDLAAMVLGAPPMPGAEYLTEEVLEALWTDLDAWVRHEVASSRDGLTGFLERRAPLWHQVGRVCFHVAENRRDPDHPFAFLATYAPTLARGGRVQYQPLGNALRQYAGARNRKALIRLLAPVERAAELSPAIRELVDSGDIHQPLAWTPRQAYRFLKDVPLFEESGVLVRLPDWWKKKNRSKPRVGISIGNRRQKAFDAAGMLDFRVELALGDETLSESEWQTLMAADEGLVLLRGQWVEVDHAKLEEALAHFETLEQTACDGLSFAEGMRLLAGAPRDLGKDDAEGDGTREWSFARAGEWLGDVLRSLREPETLTQVRPGRALEATLRPYQEAGLNWLWFLSRLGLGACLADDMGLGKTIQVLALLLALKKGRSSTSKPSLLVVPASLLANWKAEIERFAPSLDATFVHPSEMARDEIAGLAAAPGDSLRGRDAVLTTYGMLLRQPWLLDVEWRLVVIDEAQAIKNAAARQTRAVKRTKADARIALTGTPIENSLSDLWSLFDFLCPGLLGTQKRFRDFVKALEKREDHSYAPLRQLVRPYILRRMKTDRRVIQDLPDKTEVRAFCGLGKRQAVLYKGLVEDLADAIENQDGIRRRGLVLAYLLRFKQLCNHPSQLLDDGCFDPRDSGKFQRLREICDEIASRQEKALVFTQFRVMTEPLAEFLTSVFGRPGLVLHGGTPVKRRRPLIDRFQREDGPPFFVLSLKAGGTGLNLTAATHVIHFDRWWNPAVENQATDRAFRIGQLRGVLVHKFVCQGTIEERIDALLEAKTRVASDVLEGGAEKALTEMADEELIDFVSLDLERARV